MWQGFAAAGFGDGAHPLPIVVVLVPLFAAGWILFWSQKKAITRVTVALIAVGLACAAWWLVPCWVGGMPLREAVTLRDQIRERLSTPTLEDMESGVLFKIKCEEIRRQYLALGVSLERDLHRWSDEIRQLIVARFREIPPDDVATARVFAERTTQFSRQMGPSLTTYHATERWVARATDLKVRELEEMPLGDWDAFGRTAPNRLLLTEIGWEETHDAIKEAEETWANESVESLIKHGRGAGYGERLLAIEKDILALKSLNTSEDRFKEARKRLFAAAHEYARTSVVAHLDAGRYELAFGLARRHAVEWNATAALLGPDELKKVDTLRETCEFFDKLAAKAAKPADAPDVAPEPRPKPEK